MPPASRPQRKVVDPAAISGKRYPSPVARTKPSRNAAAIGRGRKRRVDTVLIVNPNSCSGLTGKNWNVLYGNIRGILGKNLKVVWSRKPGDGTRLARNFLKKGFTTIVAIGGDGTINEVANGFFETPAGIHMPFSPVHNDDVVHARTLAGKEIPANNATPPSVTLKMINPEAVLGIVPCGTRNVLVKSLDLPGGVVECCRHFMGGRPMSIDVISATATNPEDNSATPPRIFLNAAEIGFGAEIISRSKRIRKEVNSRLLSTVASIITTLPAYQSNPCEISIDDGREKIQTKMTMGVVANGRFIGGGIMAAPDAKVSDGLLDLLILKNTGSFAILDKIADIKSGDFADDLEIIYTQARKVSVTSKERDIAVTIDGEPIGKLPATFQVIKGALTIRT